MQAVARYRVLSPLLAVRSATHTKRFVTIPEGAEIETGVLPGAGLVPVTLNGETLLAFDRDIMDRAELIHERALAKGA